MPVEVEPVGKRIPVPSKVMARETDDSPLINVRTASGARRPILHERRTFFDRIEILSLNELVGDDQCDDEGEEFNGIHDDIVHRWVR